MSNWFTDLFSSENTQDQSFTRTQNPWASQSPFLTGGFEQALAALRRSQGAANTGAPTDFVAGPSQGMYDMFRQMQSFGTNGVGNVWNGGNNVANAGAGALTGALTGINGFTPGATGDAIRSEAEAYANSPAADGIINASLRDPYRQLTENDLPSNLRNASARGTNMSNKVQQRAAILDRGFQDRAADVTANVRGGLYSQGIDAASRNLQANDATRLGALTAALQGGTNALGAGVDANTAAVGQAGGLFDIANRGAVGEVAGNQSSLDNLMQRWNFNTNVQPWAGLGNYWGVVGSNNWGGTTSGTGTQTTTSTPSTAAALGSLAGTASSFIPGGSSFASMFGGMPFGTGTRGQNWWS